MGANWESMGWEKMQEGIGEYFSSNIKWIPPSHPLKPLVAIPKQDATYILSL